MTDSLKIKRRIQIFATGIVPLLVLWLFLSMASAYGLDVFKAFTTFEKRDASNYVVVTKVLGVAIASRPATQTELTTDDTASGIVRIAILSVSVVVAAVAFLMCFTSVVGRPKKLLFWFDRKLGSVQWSGHGATRNYARTEQRTGIYEKR